MSEIHILKFGGSSLRNHTFIRQAAEVVQKRTKSAQPVVVVSAIGGVTDRLLELTNGLRHKPEAAEREITNLQKLHWNVLKRITGDNADKSFRQLEILFEELNQVYFDDEFKKADLRAWRDHVIAFGERASAQIFAAALSFNRLQARALDAHHFIKTDANFGEANVIPELTRRLVGDAVLSQQGIAVITGFIGSTKQKQITTLGRSGSDYTAGLVADALNAGHLEIWTDVDGVLTADPKVVPTARYIEKLSYDDISELSAHGAKVIHPKTIRPIRRADTSVLVRNSYNPTHPGTLINRTFETNGTFRSITVTGPFTYFEVDSPDAYILAGLLQKELEPLNDTEGFSFSKPSDYEPAHFLIKQVLFEQIKAKVHSWITEHKGDDPDYIRDLYKVKKFTNRLKESDDTIIKMLNLLSGKNIRPLRINRDHNQRHVSLLLEKEEAHTTARLLNDYLIDRRTTIDLFVAGRGAIGGTLLKQIHALNSDDVRLRVIGVCNSQQVNWDTNGIDINELDNLPEGKPTDWSAIVQELTSPHRCQTIFVDATGSEEIARVYPDLLKAGVHIATPSKLANTFEQSFYDSIHQTAHSAGAGYRYETTVGAGLPVISTINDLLQSGDSITGISGVLSGTMTYLFDELGKGAPFSQAVVRARDLGYAEPDPRDDLSGEDVARKFLTLARITGLKIERSQLTVESLIPEPLQNTDKTTFLNRLSEFDEYWEQQFKKANDKGKTLRYVGSLTNGQIEIGVQEVPINSPMGQLGGTDNIIYIHTTRYKNAPIIIQGPGAGKQVTAAGLLTDIFKIAKEI